MLFDNNNTALSYQSRWLKAVLFRQLLSERKQDDSSNAVYQTCQADLGDPIHRSHWLASDHEHHSRIGAHSGSAGDSQWAEHRDAPVPELPHHGGHNASRTSRLHWDH